MISKRDKNEKVRKPYLSLYGVKTEERKQNYELLVSVVKVVRYKYRRYRSFRKEKAH
jgi:hypothetical protein